MSATAPTRKRRADLYVPKEQRPLTRFYCNDCNHKFRCRLLANRNTNAVQHYCSLYKKIITRKIHAHSNKCEGNHGINACIIQRDPIITDEESEDETKRAYYEDQGKEYPTSKRKKRYGNRRSQPKKKRQKYNSSPNTNQSQYGHGIQPHTYPYGQTQYTQYQGFYHPHPHAYVRHHPYQQRFSQSMMNGNGYPPPTQLIHQSSADQPPMPEFISENDINGNIHSNYRGECISPPSIIPCAIPNPQNRGRILKQPMMNELLPLPPPLEKIDDDVHENLAGFNSSVVEKEKEKENQLYFTHNIEGRDRMRNSEKSVSEQQLNGYSSTMLEAGEVIPMPLRNDEKRMEEEMDDSLKGLVDVEPNMNGSSVGNVDNQKQTEVILMEDKLGDEVSSEVVLNGNQNGVSLVISKEDDEDDEDFDLILDVPQ